MQSMLYALVPYFAVKHAVLLRTQDDSMEVETQDEAKDAEEISKDVRVANLHPNEGDRLSLATLELSANSDGGGQC